MNEDILEIAKTYPEYQALMNIARTIRENNLANNFNYNDIETIQTSLFIKATIEQLLGCPIEVVLRALKQDYIYIGKKQRQISISLYLDDDGNFAFDGEYKLKDYGKKWWLKEDMSE